MNYTPYNFEYRTLKSISITDKMFLKKRDQKQSIFTKSSNLKIVYYE